MNNQEAVDAFAKNLKTTMKKNESKTDKAKSRENRLTENKRNTQK